MVEKMRVLVQQNVMQLGICVRLVRQNDISAQHTYAKGGFDIRGCTSANFDGAAGPPPDLAQQGSRAAVPWPGLPRSADGFAILQRVTNQQKNCAEQPDCTQKQSDRQVCDRLRLARQKAVDTRIHDAVARNHCVRKLERQQQARGAEQVQQHHGQHAEMRLEACAPHKIDYNNQQTAPQKCRYKGKQGYLHIISLLCSAAQLRTDRPFFPARQSAFLPARIRLIWQVF